MTGSPSALKSGGRWQGWREGDPCGRVLASEPMVAGNVALEADPRDENREGRGERVMMQSYRRHAQHNHSVQHESKY